MNVFILTKGMYDDYTVVAVVSDKSTAEKFLADEEDYYELRDYEEFELDKI